MDKYVKRSVSNRLPCIFPRPSNVAGINYCIFRLLHSVTFKPPDTCFVHSGNIVHEVNLKQVADLLQLYCEFIITIAEQVRKKSFQTKKNKRIIAQRCHEIIVT
jgi:hypothetical protein